MRLLFPVLITIAISAASCSSSEEAGALAERDVAEAEAPLKWEARPDGSQVALSPESGAKCWPSGSGYRCILGTTLDLSRPASTDSNFVDQAVDIANDYAFDATVTRVDVASLPARLGFPTDSDALPELYYSCNLGTASPFGVENVSFRGKSIRNNWMIEDTAGEVLQEDEVNAYGKANSPTSPAPYFDCLAIAGQLAEHGIERLLLSDISASMARAD